MSASPAPIAISRPRIDEHAAHYGAYIAEVAGDDALAALESLGAQSDRLLAPLSEDRALHRYAPGKWSVKEIVGHLCDSERVFTYRALRFARNDATPLAGFDENLYVPEGRFDRRPILDLLDEWRAVRAASLAFYRSLDEASLLRRGVASERIINVRALAWVTVGHALHHLRVLRERYGVS